MTLVDERPPTPEDGCPACGGRPYRQRFILSSTGLGHKFRICSNGHSWRVDTRVVLTGIAPEGERPPNHLYFDPV